MTIAWIEFSGIRLSHSKQSAWTIQEFPIRSESYSNVSGLFFSFSMRISVHGNTDSAILILARELPRFLSCRKLAAILIKRHRRGGGDVVRVGQAVDWDFNHVIDQLQFFFGQPEPFVAYD